jgi:GR25 family glycosyltransferase involved in LPS biosynthesis
MKHKLNNFPPIYYVSLKDCTERQSTFEEQFIPYGITNINMIEAYDGRSIDFCKENDIVDGVYFDNMNSGEVGTAISHLKAIFNWYQNSDSEYAIFFEDDMSIESVNYWNFTWQEFIDQLPKDWNLIQLSLIKTEIEENDMRLNYRHWDINWSAGSYLIKRNYAEKLINWYLKDKKYLLKIECNEETIPYVETTLFTPAVRTAYTMPLFFERIDFVSTFYQHFLKETHKKCQIDSSNYVKYWWKIRGKQLSLDNFKLQPEFDMSIFWAN